MNLEDSIKDIKSVNIRSTQIKKRLLMSHAMVTTFQTLLAENLDSEVLIINTNTGMEVYYYAYENYFDAIKRTVFSYLSNHVHSDKLKFRNNQSREEVYQSFTETFFTFSKYPQLFLAYTKKFKHLRNTHTESPFIMPILNTFFDNSLKLLAETGSIPHYKKIVMSDQTNKTSFLEDSVIKELIAEILLKMHSN